MLCRQQINDGVGVVLGHEVMVNHGVQEGTKHAPLRGPSVEDQCGRCVAYPDVLPIYVQYV